MPTPVLIYPDPLLATMAFLRLHLPTRPETYVTGVQVGSEVPGARPLPFVWCRPVGGFTTGRATDRARVDFHCYHRTEKQARDLAQMVRGLILAMPSVDSTVIKGAAEFSGPGPAPDQFWPATERYYFTVELSLRGVEAFSLP